jgi:SNF2 family DNA or RNA helicase
MNLYSYQKEALELIKDKNRCAIYYDMGLGKTFIGSEKLRDLDAKVNLIVCQKSKVDDWIDHFKNNYDKKLMIFDCTKQKELALFINADPTWSVIGVINYDLVWRRKELLKLKGFTLLLDESSLITNPKAERSKFILKMNPANVILLSGTPTAGKYEKLWGQLKLLGWNIDEDTYFKSYVDYKWVDRDGYWDKEIIGYKNVDHLKKRLAKFGAIFKKTDEVIDLPEQVEQMIYIDPSKEYKFFKKHHYLEIDDKELMGDTALTRILYERQLCGQYSDDKLTAFQELLRESDGRFIVFYNFNDELKKLMNLADGVDKPISIVNGNEKSLECYEQYDNSITFVQYQAGAYGLNLQKANKIIYFTLPLGIGSCDLWEQSKKRIHRIGQGKTCFYYYLLVKDSIETWNLELLKTGKELTDDLFKVEE